ncbi:DUF4031 domain-containing protein [Burkholderia metallica]|uniref:DUF4031 domain-containing protein n=1 Tax=Burkholderia metallica TaxID=488729 RepID=UPI001CF4714C|nr:DUF4031 domain-containing protein [Burkholderia metallica]MCA8017754.1 DUF4031 domain-containing protein [Burkholderia metallica]
MTVYVDDMYLYPIGEFKTPSGRTYKMSHLIADTREELVGMAVTIGLNSRHIQKRGTPGEHFDIAISKRRLAIAAGAVPVTMRQCSSMCVRRRETGELGSPTDVDAWMEQRRAGTPQGAV